MFLGVTSIPEAKADKSPSKPIKIVAPCNPGGSSDVDVRGMAPYLQRYLRVPIIVQNVVGTRGVVGYNRFYKTKPDGYSVLFFNLPSPLVHELTKKTEYRTLDYTFIRANTRKSLIFVTPYGKFNDFKDFVQQAKKTKLKVALTGPSSDLQVYIMGDGLGTELAYIPFEGAARGLAAVVGGHVDCSVLYVLGCLPLIEAEKISALLAFTEERDARIPSVPTAKELGYDVRTVPTVKWGCWCAWHAS